MSLKSQVNKYLNVYNILLQNISKQNNRLIWSKNEQTFIIKI